MNIFICDDEIEITNYLEKLLITFFRNSKIALPNITIYNDGNSLLSDPNVKDIVFLDVEMDGISGIYVGQELKKQNKNCIIIMVTAFSDYLDDAFKFQAFRYLSKPIDEARFFRNLNEAIQQYNSLCTTVNIESKNSNHVVPTEDIIMLECADKQITVHTHNGTYHSIQTMDYWENLLPSSSFFRAHKSFLVNMSHISDFNHELIFFKNYGVNAYLTKRKYTSFKKNFATYLEFRN